MSEKTTHRPRRGGPMGGGIKPAGEKAKNFKGTMGQLARYMRPYYLKIAVVFLFAIASTVFVVIGPKILGNTIGISSLGVLISILIGGGLFGLTGMLLCVPTYSVLYSLIKGASEKKLEKRGLPVQTETYTTLEQIDPETLAAVDSASPNSHSRDKGSMGSLFKRAFGKKK